MNLQTFSAVTIALLILTAAAAAQSTPVSSLTERLDPNTKEWTKVQQTTFEYNEDEQQEYSLSQIWNATDAEWTNNIQCYNTYDQRGALIVSECQAWNEAMDQWFNAQRIEIEYQGNQKSSVSSLNWNTASQDWDLIETKPLSFGNADAKSNTLLLWDHLQTVSNDFDAFGRKTLSTSTSHTQGMERKLRTTFKYNDGTAKTSLTPDARLRNYPNPVVNTTQFAFELVEQADVLIQVFNAQGKQIAALSETTLSAGAHEMAFDASDLSSGFYLFTLTANGSRLASNTMVVAAR